MWDRYLRMEAWSYSVRDGGMEQAREIERARERWRDGSVPEKDRRNGAKEMKAWWGRGQRDKGVVWAGPERCRRGEN